MTGLRQLPLPFPHTPRFDDASFLPAPSNQAALAWLRPDADWPQRRLALWGPEGSGKTHLLHDWTRRTGARLATGPGLSFDVLVGGLTHLAIDDADLAPERDLLHLLNVTAEAQLSVLLAARLPPARWAVHLPDLSSRLRSITGAGLLAPDDALLGALLARLLAERQLAVPQAAQDWLRLRLPRTAAAMREAAALLDRAAFAAGRPIGRALAARALLDFAAAHDPPADENLASDTDGACSAMPRLL